MLILICVAMSSACSMGGERIIKVAQFPDTSECQRDVKAPYGPTKKIHIDAGYVWKQDKFLNCPIFNDKGRYVGFIGDDYRFLDLEPEEMNVLAKNANVVLPESPSLPFWDAMGGKLAAVGLLAVLIVFSLAWNAFWRFIKQGI